MNNPIATLLDIADTTPWHVQIVTIDGRAFEYHPATETTFEALYRAAAGHGVSNPAFALCYTPAPHHAMQLGRYLSGFRAGVKRNDAVARTAHARQVRTVARKRVMA